MKALGMGEEEGGVGVEMVPESMKWLRWPKEKGTFKISWIMHCAALGLGIETADDCIESHFIQSGCVLLVSFVSYI